MQNRFDLVIYDFDGTLYDTRPGLQLVFREMLEHFGYNADDYDLKEFVGPPMEWSLEHIVGAPSEQVSQMLDYFRPKYFTSAVENLVFFEGIMPMLQQLHQQKVEQAIASLKFLPTLHQIVATAKLESLFSTIAGHNPQEPKSKTQLIRQVITQTNAKNPVMIGDRDFDLIGAKEAGIAFVGVDYGYARNEQELVGSDYRMANVAQLHQFLQQHT